MNKEERLKYLHSKHIDKDDPIGELPTNQSDIDDEMYLNDGYKEHRKSVEKKLTSDE